MTEPFTIMLWGITTDRINAWLKGTSANSKQLTGMAASPGTVEGLARVIRSADELDQVKDGEILVTPVTAPSWAPVFSKISATVTDIGGMMSHAAIVCREYGLPAVTATGSASCGDQDRAKSACRRLERRSHDPLLTSASALRRRPEAAKSGRAARNLYLSIGIACGPDSIDD